MRIGSRRTQIRGKKTTGQVRLGEIWSGRAWRSARLRVRANPAPEQIAGTIAPDDERPGAKGSGNHDGVSRRVERCTGMHHAANRTGAVVGAVLSALIARAGTLPGIGVADFSRR